MGKGLFIFVGTLILIGIIALVFFLFPSVREEYEWKAATWTDSVHDYKLYLQKWPRGRHADEAQKRHQELDAAKAGKDPSLLDRMYQFQDGAQPFRAYAWEWLKLAGWGLLSLALLVVVIGGIANVSEGEGAWGKMKIIGLTVVVGLFFLASLKPLIEQGKEAFKVFHQEGRDEIALRAKLQKMVDADVSLQAPLDREKWPAKLKLFGLDQASEADLEYMETLVREKLSQGIYQLVRERLGGQLKTSLSKEEMEGLLASLNEALGKIAATLNDQRYGPQELQQMLQTHLASLIAERKIEVALEGWGGMAPWEDVSKDLQGKMVAAMRAVMAGEGWADADGILGLLRQTIADTAQAAVAAYPRYEEQIGKLAGQYEKEAGEIAQKLSAKLESLEKAAQASQLMQAAGAPLAAPPKPDLTRKSAAQALEAAQAVRDELGQLLAAYPGLNKHPAALAVQQTLTGQAFAEQERQALYAAKVAWPWEMLYQAGGSPFARFALYFLLASLVLYFIAHLTGWGWLCMTFGLFALPAVSLPLWYATGSYLPEASAGNLLAHPGQLVMWFLAYLVGLAGLCLPAAMMGKVAGGWPRHTFSFQHMDSTYSVYSCSKCGHSSSTYFNPCPKCQTRFGGTSEHISEDLAKRRQKLEEPFRSRPRYVYLPFLGLGLLVCLILHGGGFLGQVVGWQVAVIAVSAALAMVGSVAVGSAMDWGDKNKHVTFENGRLAKIQ